MAMIVFISTAVCGQLFGCRYQSAESARTNDKPNFPFTMQDSGNGVCIYLAPEHYHKGNLEDLCLWFHRNQLGMRNLRLFFFTDEARRQFFIDDSQYLVTEPEVKISKEPSSSRRTLYDACCLRSPAEPMLESDGDPLSSGYNLTLSYAQDLNQTNVKKTIVLRGSTWTQGKHNLQTQEVTGPKGKVVVMAYDIYNVEPPSRYYTFSYHTAKDNYQYKRIIFNIHQDEAAPLPINQVRFVTDEVVYIYMGWIFSVTTDAGKTWRLWDAERDLPGWTCCDSGLIREVSISFQGTGTMTVIPDSQEPEKLLQLRTNDFGQHWVNQ